MSDRPSSHLTLRLDPELLGQIDGVAKALDRSRTWVVLRALRQYMTAEGDDVLRDAEGLAALDRGEGADFDETMAELEDLVSRIEARPAKRAG